MAPESWIVLFLFYITHGCAISNINNDLSSFIVTEKTWAYLTIKQLLDKAEVTDNSTIQLQMKERALELSLKVNIILQIQCHVD